MKAGIGVFESGSERIPRGLPRGKRANGEHYYSLWIEDSPQVYCGELQIDEVI